MNPLATHDGQPLVTVQVMACAKDIHLLTRALASVAKQDLPPEMFAVQIMHDGQAEETADLERVAEAIDRLPCEASFIETPEPYGYYCLPRNYGIVYIDTPYIAFLDADNEMAAGHLRGLLAAIRTPSRRLSRISSCKAWTRGEQCSTPGAASKWCFSSPARIC